MKRLHGALMLFVVLVIVLAGCSKQSNTPNSGLENEFLTALPVKEMNKSLQIVVDNKKPTVKAGSTIGLTVYNKSSHSLSFDNGSFITLMGSVDNQHWFPVENGITYTDHMTLSPQGTTLLDFDYTWIKPILPAAPDTNGKEVLLRIVLLGKVMDGELVTEKRVGAYADLRLIP